MSRIQIPIDKGWMPDMAAHEMPPGGLTVCKNVYRHNGLWVPMNATSTSTEMGDTNTRTIISALNQANPDDPDTYIFLAVDNALYRYTYDKSAGTIGTETNVSKSGMTYNVMNGNFLYYGGYAPWVVFLPGYITAGGQELEVFKDLDASADFVALGGSPKSANYGCFFRGHLVTGFLYDAGTHYPVTVQISDNGDIEGYSTTFDILTGASLENFPDAWGWMTGMASMQDSFAIFFQGSISLGYWAGGYPVWIGFKKEIHRGIGALPNSMVSTGNAVFFLGLDDAYVLENSGACYPIGSGQVANTVCALQRADWTERFIFPFHWASKNCILWCVPSNAQSSKIPDDILIYNYKEKAWSLLDGVNCSALFSVFNTYGQEVLGGVIRSGGKEYLRLFNGAAGTATLCTGDFSMDDDILFVSEVRPKVPTTSTNNAIRVGYRNLESDSVSYTASTTVDANGKCDVRASGRLIRFELTTDKTMGNMMTAEVQKAGRR